MFAFIAASWAHQADCRLISYQVPEPLLTLRDVLYTVASIRLLFDHWKMERLSVKLAGYTVVDTCLIQVHWDCAKKISGINILSFFPVCCYYLVPIPLVYFWKKTLQIYFNHCWIIFLTMLIHSGFDFDYWGNESLAYVVCCVFLGFFWGEGDFVFVF